MCLRANFFLFFRCSALRAGFFRSFRRLKPILKSSLWIVRVETSKSRFSFNLREVMDRFFLISLPILRMACSERALGRPRGPEEDFFSITFRLLQIFLTDASCMSNREAIAVGHFPWENNFKTLLKFRGSHLSTWHGSIKMRMKEKWFRLYFCRNGFENRNGRIFGTQRKAARY